MGLDRGTKACLSSGTVLTADARSARDTVTEEVGEAKETAQSLEEYKLLDQLKQVARDHPERTAEVLQDLLNVYDLPNF